MPVISPVTGEEIATVPRGHATTSGAPSPPPAPFSPGSPVGPPLSDAGSATPSRMPSSAAARPLQSNSPLNRGKPYHAEALGEVDTTAEMFRLAAEDITRLESAVIPSSDAAKRIITMRQPRGTYGVITPWNFPLAIPSEGPIAPVLTFDDEDEAVAIANSAPSGLVAALLTHDLGRAFRIAERLQAGIVNINESTAYWQLHTPFGGYSGKASGVGRLGGKYTLLEMSQIKTLVLDVGAKP
jgi:acyl-CoA reductase-like NAD-dependent aldehyde dehydrogenase